MKLINFLTKLPLCLALIITNCGNAQNLTNSNKSISAGSDFIFVGKVYKSYDSNVSFVKADKNTYIVTIEDVLKAPEGLDNFEKREITVKSDVDLTSQTKGSNIFYSTIWLYGESLAVVANKIEPSGKNNSDVQKQIDGEIQAKQDGLIRERLETARSVVLAKVVDLKKLDISERKKESEHNPNWEISVIEVIEVIKGEKVDRFLFPNSRDVHWYRVPKMKVGQEGIFILQPSKDAFSKNYLQINDSKDFQPTNQLERIKNLIK